MFDLLTQFFAPACWPSRSLQQYGDLWMMGCSSAQTVFYRSLMIQDACLGRIAFTHPEFSRMSQEKLDAALEGTLAGTMQFQRLMLDSIHQPPLTPVTALNRMLDASVELVDASMKPVHEAAHANAARLSRQAAAQPQADSGD